MMTDRSSPSYSVCLITGHQALVDKHLVARFDTEPRTNDVALPPCPPLRPAGGAGGGLALKVRGLD